ncbi:MAG: helix-turn-helix domain-containing protein [Acidobacteriota bacterium]
MSARPEDWEMLGLEPGADLGQVKRAYRQRKALYQPTELATYNLLDADERAEMVIRIDEAYERILASEPEVPDPATAPPAAAPRESAPAPIPDAPDPELHPGEHLRHHRGARGFTLHQIAAETKINIAILEQIENEDFAALPATAFVRGHVHQIAREIKLEHPYEFAKMYVAKMEGSGEEE